MPLNQLFKITSSLSTALGQSNWTARTFSLAIGTWCVAASRCTAKSWTIWACHNGPNAFWKTTCFGTMANLTACQAPPQPQITLQLPSASPKHPFSKTTSLPLANTNSAMLAPCAPLSNPLDLKINFTVEYQNGVTSLLWARGVQGRVADLKHRKILCFCKQMY